MHPELFDAVDRLDSGQLAALRERIESIMDGDGSGRASGEGGRKGGALRPCRIFSVPPEIKYLEPGQMQALTDAFSSWVEASRDVRTRLSRERMFLIYLVLRYSGARLGEVLAIDDRRDFDRTDSSVTFRGEAGGGEDGDALDGERRVVLPEAVMEEILARLDTPGLTTLAGTVFHADQGFVRRKFQEQEARSGIPRELLNPRVLRNSRAIELLRSGVPLYAVQSVLGHSSIGLTSSLLRFRERDLQHIIHDFVRKEAKMKTSARNTFVGEVTEVRSGNILCEVELTTAGGHKVVSVITNESRDNLGIAPGRTMVAVVKAPWVIVAKEKQLTETSARNRFKGRITRINTGEISAEIVGDLDDGTSMCALITDESIANLDLKIGDDIWFLFKAFSVILNVD